MDITLHFHTVSRMLSDKGLAEQGAVQKVVDSEVLRRCDPYIPMDTGVLKKSGTLGTVIGSGKVVYKCVYARKNYYQNAGKGRDGTSKGGLRGKLWFERMKAEHLNEIIEAAHSKLGESE